MPPAARRLILTTEDTEYTKDTNTEDILDMPPAVG